MIDIQAQPLVNQFSFFACKVEENLTRHLRGVRPFPALNALST